MPASKRPVVLIKVDRDQTERWQQALLRMRPDLELRTFPFVGDPESVDVALVWNPPQGLLASLSNLQAVVSIGAGVDHILKDPQYPRKVPLVRMVDPGLTQGMVEYIVMSTLLCSRHMYKAFLNQSLKQWDAFEAPLSKDVNVGILGLGNIGLEAALALKGLGFKVLGWSRTEKFVEGLTTFHASAGLERMLSWCEILVNVLPLTDETRGILGAGTFNRLPKGARVINVGRGEHCVEADLIKALDSGRLSAAVLDVFQTEPLPTDSPLWHHEKVIVTPHFAGVTAPETAAAALITTLDEIERDLPLSNRVNLHHGY